MSFFDNILDNVLGKPPKAPDYVGAANATAAADKELATQQNWANRPDQVTPFGVQRWGATSEIDPATGLPVDRWTQLTELDPDMQKALDDQQAIDAGKADIAKSMLGRSRDEFGQPIQGASTPGAQMFDQSSLEPVDRGNQIDDIYYGDAHAVGDPNAYRDKVEQTSFDKARSRLDPVYNQAESDMDIKLRNQGLKPGDEAYDRAFANQSRAKNDAYENARMDSVLGGGVEADRLFQEDVQRRGLDTGEIEKRLATRTASADRHNQLRQDQISENIQTGGYQNTLRQQQIAEELQRRGASLNEINAVLSGTQVEMPDMPGYNTAGRSQAPDLMGAAQNQYGAAVDKSNFNQMQKQGLISAAGSFFSGFG